tara:strand:- start:1418 stop:1693 length:276 start_codon:yes stop_codon:yes gene_type:complete
MVKVEIIYISVFNNGKNGLASTILETFTTKLNLAAIEGHLKMIDYWVELFPETDQMCGYTGTFWLNGQLIHVPMWDWIGTADHRICYKVNY